MRRPAPCVANEKRRAAFLRQAGRGPQHWRLQRVAALCMVVALLLGAGYALWTTWQADGDFSDAIWPILLWLSLAVAASMWAVHAELMEGAALHLAEGEARGAEARDARPGT